MKNLKSLYILLGVELLTIPAVIIIFKLIADRKIAALVAACFFIIIPAVALWKITDTSKIFTAAHWQFLVLFALPIFILRITHWSQEFDTIEFMGVAAASLHKYSNISFGVMLAGAALELYRTTANKKLLI